MTILVLLRLQLRAVSMTPIWWVICCLRKHFLKPHYFLYRLVLRFYTLQIFWCLLLRKFFDNSKLCSFVFSVDDSDYYGIFHTRTHYIIHLFVCSVLAGNLTCRVCWKCSLITDQEMVTLYPDCYYTIHVVSAIVAFHFPV